MKKHCWRNWVPGVLSDEQIRELVAEDCLLYLDPESGDLDPSAIDLRLQAGKAWKMKKGAVKPFGSNYDLFLQNSEYAEEIRLDGPLNLETRTTYVFKLKLEFSPKFMKESRFYGHATGRSSVGRVDVLTRLVVDGMDQYEGFTAERLAKHGDGKDNGKLYLEVTPITFTVQVKSETALSQLRLFLGTPESCLIRGKDIVETTLRIQHNHDFRDGALSLSLEPEQYDGVSAFGAKMERAETNNLGARMGVARAPVCLWKLDEDKKPNPSDYWRRIPAQEGVEFREWFLEVQHTYFYILKSYEKLCLPPGVAVYCKPSDETIGEMRIHYAGFVHPWFGMNREDRKEGTPLIFEVRGHDLPTVLGHKEKLARLEFYRMSQDPIRPKVLSFPVFSESGQMRRL
jgi:dCTP deaminase